MTTGERQDTSLGEDLQRGREELIGLGAAAIDLGREVRELARREVELARAEVAEQVQLTVRTAILAAVALTFGFLALAFLATAATWALAEVMPVWAGALVVTAVLAVVAAIAALAAMAQLRQITVVPSRTFKSLGETARWARELTRLKGA